MSANKNEGTKVDIYRDTPLRYAGYLNEIGEAFRPVVASEFVTFSYVLAITYVFADAISKGGETAELTQNTGKQGCGKAAVFDTLFFQLVASIITPGYTINRWVALVVYAISQFDPATQIENALGVTENQVLASVAGIDISVDGFVNTLPTALGLALIPFIVAPIDGATEFLLDEFIRPQLLKTFPQCTLPFCDRAACKIVEPQE
jgi:fission process protein 1